MFMIFLTVCVDEDLSNLRSSSKDNRESDDLPISPRVLIDKLINLMVEWLGMRSDIREWYFAFFRSLLMIIIIITIMDYRIRNQKMWCSMCQKRKVE